MPGVYSVASYRLNSGTYGDIIRIPDFARWRRGKMQVGIRCFVFEAFKIIFLCNQAHHPTESNLSGITTEDCDLASIRPCFVSRHDFAIDSGYSISAVPCTVAVDRFQTSLSLLRDPVAATQLILSCFRNSCVRVFYANKAFFGSVVILPKADGVQRHLTAKNARQNSGRNDFLLQCWQAKKFKRQLPQSTIPN